MGVIIGILVRLVTFPGLIVDAFVLKIVCRFLDIPVFKVNYFDILAKDGGVEHEIPENYFKVFILTILPFVVMSLFSIFLFYWIFSAKPSVDGHPFHIITMWVAVSIGAHSFPTTKLANMLWKSSVDEVKKMNLLALMGFPVVILIYIFRILHIFWFDIIYGVLLGAIVANYIENGKFPWQ